jgi:hypothetical protein
MKTIALNSLHGRNGKRDTGAENAVMIIIVKAKNLIRDAAPVVNKRNQPLPIPYFMAVTCP